MSQNLLIQKQNLLIQKPVWTSLNQFDIDSRISSQNFLIIFWNFQIFNILITLKIKKWQRSSDQRANVHIFIKEYFR